MVEVIKEGRTKNKIKSRKYKSMHKKWKMKNKQKIKIK